MSRLPDFKPLTSVEEVNAMLKFLRDQKCHVLPAALPLKIDRVPDSHQICFFPKLFDPDPKGPDMYHDHRMPEKHVGIKHSALVELWNAAGGQPVFSSQVREQGDPDDPYYVKWRYCGKYCEIGGTWIPETQSKRIDLREGSAQIKNMPPAMLTQQRASIYEIAESKTFSRVIRKALGIRSSYHESDAALPFIIIRPMLVVDMKDPLTRALLVANSIGASAALFGNADFVKALMAPTNGDEQEPESPALPASSQRALTAGTPPERSPEEIKQDSLRDFEAADTDGQSRTLDALILKKGYDRKSIPATYNKLNPKHRMSFFKKLIDMPDKTVEDPFLSFGSSVNL